MKHRHFLFVVILLLVGVRYFSQQNKVDSLVRVSAKEKTDTIRLSLLVKISREYDNIGSFDSSVAFASRAIEFAEALLNRNPGSPLKRTLIKYKGTAYNYRGIAYRDLGNFPEALKNLFVSLKINESLDEKFGIATAYNNIGLVYMSQRDFDKALPNYFAGLKLYKEIKFARGIASAYNNIGIVYKSMRKLPEALNNHLAAFRIRDSIGDKKGIATSYNNIGIVYDDMGKYEEAVKNHLEGLDIRQKLGDKAGIAGSQSNLGRAFMRMKKFKEAEKYYTEARILAEQIGHKEYLQHIYGGLAELDSLRGNFAQAFNYLNLHHRIRDSLDNEDTRRKTIQTQLTYEFEKKDAVQKAEHEKEMMKKNAESILHKKSRNYVLIISILLILLICVAFIYYNIRKSLRLKEGYSRQLLRAQEQERQRISKELHDSVGQNVLFIKNQVIKSNDLRLLPTVDETLDEVRSISKDLYPNQLEKYGLAAAVDALVEKLQATTSIFASHDLSGLKTNLSPDEQIQYYRIIQECISNAVKHASATALRITAERKNNSTELIIQDDGKGFDKAALVSKAQHSFGMLNLEERAKYLKGKMEVESAPGKGTRLVFIFPG
jgi:signal transduction histidine kinase